MTHALGYYSKVFSNARKYAHQKTKPAPVTRSDARAPGIQTVAGLILRSGNILYWRLVMKSLLGPFCSYSWFKYGSNYAIYRKGVDFVKVNRLGSLHRNSVDRLTDRLNITLVVDWAVKPQHKIIFSSTCWKNAFLHLIPAKTMIPTNLELLGEVGGGRPLQLRDLVLMICFIKPYNLTVGKFSGLWKT